MSGIVGMRFSGKAAACTNVLNSFECSIFSTRLSFEQTWWVGKNTRHVEVICRYVYITTGGADKSLARPNSRCRRTKSIVLFEREVCSCAELQVFSCYRYWKEACQATRAISTTRRREMSSRLFFSAKQGAEGNSSHSDWNIRGTCTIVCHLQRLGSPV